MGLCSDIGSPPGLGWDLPRAEVVCAPQARLGQEDVAIHLQQYVDSGRINRWAIPREVQIVDDIPKTGIGKIDKKRIRELVMTQGLN